MPWVCANWRPGFRLYGPTTLPTLRTVSVYVGRNTVRTRGPHLRPWRGPCRVDPEVPPKQTLNETLGERTVLIKYLLSTNISSQSLFLFLESMYWWGRVSSWQVSSGTTFAGSRGLPTDLFAPHKCVYKVCVGRLASRNPSVKTVRGVVPTQLLQCGSLYSVCIPRFRHTKVNTRWGPQQSESLPF